MASTESMESRFDPDSYTSDKHWGQQIAEEVIKQFPNEEVYTCAAGISPSGIVHFGNFRDVITAYVVSRELARMGKKTSMLYSWDDFDRLRKVPANVGEAFAEHIGKPLARIPNPLTGILAEPTKGDGSKSSDSYARHFELPFEQAMSELKMELDYRYQSREYPTGAYVEDIREALQKRKEIAAILLSFMTEKGKEEKKIVEADYIENFYPTQIYSRFSGRDNTKVLSYDGEYTITYKCFDTNQEDTINIRTSGIVKLQWKVDWPMRWRQEGVVFEPGGSDHASPGSSYDVGTVMSPKIFGRAAPLFAEYRFVGIQGLGTKMSGSKGNAVSVLELLDIYEPAVLKWLYMRKTPAQAFQLAFDSEVYRQYEEFDKELVAYAAGTLDNFSKRALELALEGFENEFGKGVAKPIPFRQAVAFGQIVQWDVAKLINFLSKINLDYDTASIEARLPKAKAWLEKYNPSEMIVIRDRVHEEYAKTISEDHRKYIAELRAYLLADIANGGAETVEALEAKIYAIPKDESIDQKENAKRQRAFFKDVYNLLISADTGPRLSTFIWAIGKEKAAELISI